MKPQLYVVIFTANHSTEFQSLAVTVHQLLLQLQEIANLLMYITQTTNHCQNTTYFPLNKQGTVPTGSWTWNQLESGKWEERHRNSRITLISTSDTVSK